MKTWQNLPKVWNWPIPHFSQKVWNWSIPHFWKKMLWFHGFFKAYSVFVKSVELTNSICFAKVWNWSIPHFWRKSCGYVVKSHQLDWNAIPILFKKLDWKIHNSSLEWKQSNTRPSASCRIVFTLVNRYGFSNPTFWTGWDCTTPSMGKNQNTNEIWTKIEKLVKTNFFKILYSYQLNTL